MAAGDITIFDTFRKDVGDGVHTLGSDTIKVALLKRAASPDKAASNAAYATYSGNESTTGGEYSAGGKALTDTGFSLTGGRAVFSAEKFVVNQDSGNPTDAGWALIYNDSSTGKKAIAFVDLGAAKDLQTTSIELRWNSIDGVGEIFRI